MQSQFIDNILWHTERGIDGLEAGISQKREASDAEECMEYVGHVACAIGEAACLCILAGENELLQLLGTDPVQTTHNGQWGEHPPGVAYIGKFLGATIESARGQLTLAEPPAQLVHVQQMQTLCER